MLSCFQLNMNRSATAMTHWTEKVRKREGFLLCVSEPNIVKGKVVSRPGNTKVYPLSGVDKQRTAIIVSKGTNCTQIEKLCSKDCTVIQITTGRENILIASVYCDIKEDLKRHDMLKVIKYAQGKKIGLVLCCDTNAHSTLYGPSNNKRGDTMDELIVSNGLKVENFGSTPTFQTIRGGKVMESYIDATFSLNLEGNAIRNWRVDDGYNGSDHNTVMFDLVHAGKIGTRARKWSKADWPLFTEHLLEAGVIAIPEKICAKRLDDMINKLYRLINGALDKVCPKVETNFKMRKNKWYNEDLRWLGRKVEKLYAKMRRNPIQQNILRHRKTEQQYKRKCKKERNNAWNRYKQTMSRSKDVANLVKMVEKEQNREITTLTKENNEITAPGRETLDELVKAHFPNSLERKSILYSEYGEVETREIRTRYKKWINVALIEQVFNNFKSKKQRILFSVTINYSVCSYYVQESNSRIIAIQACRLLLFLKEFLQMTYCILNFDNCKCLQQR